MWHTIQNLYNFIHPGRMKAILVLLNKTLLHFKPLFKLIIAHCSPRRYVLRRRGSIVGLINVVSRCLMRFIGVYGVV